MKSSSIAITATFAESVLLKNLVEKLADRRTDAGYHFEELESGWQAIRTASIEANVSGDIILSDQKNFISLSFVTCFLFSCIKEKESGYSFTWASSLS